MTTISLRHITKRFGQSVALDDVSLDIAPGERLGLVGENGAGKSSLMNVLYGLYQPDSGDVAFDGAVTQVKTPQVAIARGVGMVHQHFTLVPNLSVAENVVLGDEPTRGGLLDLDAAQKVVRDTCQRLGFVLDPSARVDSLTVGSQQKVEIVKALRRGAKVLILDEPTAVLTPQEVDELYAVTRALSAEGCAVVLITHKLTEVLAYATRIAVMRRGKKVAEVTPAETNPQQLAEMMVGQSTVPAANTERTGTRGAAVLSLEKVSARGVREVSLTLHAGEIVGIAGVDGNGQRELAEVVTGLRAFSSGSVTIHGVAHRHLNPGLTRSLGITHIPEDRLLRALVGEMSVEENVSLGRQRQAPFAKGVLIDLTGRLDRTARLLKDHDVRPPDPSLRAAGLSGGNQQKLVVGRELDAEPKVLVVVQPTRGLDIHAVAAVRRRLLEQANRGCAVLLISLDLDEVTALADRVLVMFEGALNGEFPRERFDARELGRHMLGAARA